MPIESACILGSLLLSATLISVVFSVTVGVDGAKVLRHYAHRLAAVPLFERLDPCLLVIADEDLIWVLESRAISSK